MVGFLYGGASGIAALRPSPPRHARIRQLAEASARGLAPPNPALRARGSRHILPFKKPTFVGCLNGGASGTRTPDFLLAKQAL